MFYKTASLSAALALALFSAGGAMAEDAMSPMAPMMSDADLTMCVTQAKAITFPEVAMVAEAACQTLHNGHDAMGGTPMGGDAMGGDAMRGGDAMAPKQ